MTKKLEDQFHEAMPWPVDFACAAVATAAAIATVALNAGAADPAEPGPGSAKMCRLNPQVSS